MSTIFPLGARAGSWWGLRRGSWAMRTAAIDRKSQLDAAIKEIVELVRDGLRHGYFDYRISCEKGQKGKRHLIVWAGKSHKFTIPEDEL